MEDVIEQKKRERVSSLSQGQLAQYGRQTLGVVLALVLSALAVWVATGFTRQAPGASGPPPGLTVAEGKIDLTAAAPQWRVLKLGTAVPVSAQWTDDIPAWVYIDET